LYLQDYSIILNGKKQEKNDPKINYFRQLINFTFYETINSMSKILEDIQNPQIIGFWGYITPKLGKTAVKMDFGLPPT